MHVGKAAKINMAEALVPKEPKSRAAESTNHESRRFTYQDFSELRKM
jgi:hypothetical protein